MKLFVLTSFVLSLSVSLLFQKIIFIYFEPKLYSILIKDHSYKDFVIEAKRLSEQLRICGVSLIVALTNFDDPESQPRLLTECGSLLNLVLSSSSLPSGDVFKVGDDQSRDTETPAVHALKFESNSLDYLYLITLRLEVSGYPKIAHIDLDKYYVD